ncbi:MAG: hypothetical protein FJ086_14160 [Deltaproteobacteria bacterium]|nr:hypothetical protein [Deltaproteobacteria bacterium]
MARLLSLPLLLAGSLAAAGDLSPAQKAKIQYEQQKALEEVQKKYGNRKPSELSNAERRAMAQEQAEADRKVLERNGVSHKDWAVSSVRMGRSEKSQVEAAGKELQAADEAAQKKKAGAAGSNGPSEVKIQRGFGNDMPAVMEDKGSSEPEIEIQRGPTNK